MQTETKWSVHLQDNCAIEVELDKRQKILPTFESFAIRLASSERRILDG